MQRLRELRGEVPEMSGAALTEAERSFVSALRAEGVPARSRRPLFVTVAGLTTAAAAALAVALTLPGPPGVQTRTGSPSTSPGSPAPVVLKPVSVAEVLDLAAAAGDGVAPGPGQFVVTESVVMAPAEFGEGGRYLYRAKLTNWISADNTRPGAARSEQLVPLAYPGLPIPPQAPRAGTVDLHRVCPVKGDAARQDYAYYATLPADPAGMLAYFGRFPGGGGDKNFSLWKAGGELAGAAMPAAQRTAVFRALKLIPGAQLAGDAQDVAGRSGTAIGYVDARRGLRHELIFDPVTFRFLGSRDVVVDAAKAQAPAGTVLGATAQLSITVTAEAPAAPLGPKQASCE
ncbi:CU044_5270 family protein [Dactylosporangium sp. NPDC051485]|uniref:CU044_5270 family protein n=1 Tax=Dactylosporangium sp. NPDC051485 TaxID=3154846 RepID=UPI003427943E